MKKMSMYDAVCPVCGKLNRGLNLEETHGTMECEKCGSVVEVIPGAEGNAVAVLARELRTDTLLRAM